MSWRGLSVFGLLMLTVGAMMSAPAILAISVGDLPVARVFAMCGLVTATAAALLILATYRRPSGAETRSEFAVLIGALLIAPVAAAAPLSLALPYLSFEASYFEMVSMITTTGATVFDRIGDVHPAVKLWRALVAWLGGLIALVMAFALLAPRNLGGFEVRGDLGRSGAVGRLKGDPVWAGGREREAAADRIARAIRDVAPVYGGLTVALAAALVAFGSLPLDAFVSAIGVMSTSGVKSVNGPAFAAGGMGAEVVVACCLVLAATRHTFGGAGQGTFRPSRMIGDPEMRLLMIVTLGAALWLFLRHWVGALELTAAGADGEPVTVEAVPPR